MYDRLRHQIEVSGHGRKVWPSKDIGPHELLLRNFHFCTIDDPSSVDAVVALAPDKIMVETDYPHADSTWPESQKAIEDNFKDVPAASRRRILCDNARTLYGL